MTATIHDINERKIKEQSEKTAEKMIDGSDFVPAGSIFDTDWKAMFDAICIRPLEDAATQKDWT